MLTSHLPVAARTTSVARLLILILAALALAPTTSALDPRLRLLGALYVVLALLATAAWHRSRMMVPVLLALVDAAAVTALLALAPATSPALWPLYLIPIGATALDAPRPAVLGALASSVGLLILILSRFPSGGLPALWPVALLLSVALVMLGPALSRRVGSGDRPAMADSGRLRRDVALRRAVVALAASTDRAEVPPIVAEAVAEGLGRKPRVADRSLDSVGRGSSRSGETSAEGAATPDIADAAHFRQIDDHLSLTLEPMGVPLTADEEAWLDELINAVRAVGPRYAAHARLAEEERTLRAILEAVPAPLAIGMPDGEPTLANAAYRALGLDRLPAPDGSEQEVVVGEPPRTFIASTASLAEGRGVVAHYREITREREALRAKDALFAVIGHELRNPLTSIHGYSQMMSRQLGIVQQQVDQLGRLLGDFMAASALESGELPLARERVGLTELACAAADRFRGAHEGRSLRLELEDVRPIVGDPARLTQVIDNLLGNAAKYSPPDQEIVLAVRQEGDAVVLEVRDHGVGIASEHLPHLFDRFYRAPGPGADQVKGLGLGLAIARDLVAAHGGEITAESAGLGQGSTFRVRLPVVSGPPASGELAVADDLASRQGDARLLRMSRVLGAPADQAAGAPSGTGV